MRYNYIKNIFVCYYSKDGIYRMKKNYEKLPLAILLSSLGITAISVTVRIILTFTLMDAKYGVYERGSILPAIYHAALALSLIAIAALAYFKAPDRAPNYIRPSSDFTVFASLACAFLLLAELFLSLYYIIVDGAPSSTFDTLELCFSVPAIFYFLGLVRSQEKRSVPLVLLSFFPTAWCSVCLIRIYFDSSILQISPNKIIGEVALLAAMIYFLSESRSQLGVINHKVYLAMAAVAPALLLTSSLPNLLCGDRLSIGTSDNFMRYAIDAVFALFIYARLAAYARKSIPAEKSITEDTITEDISEE